MIFYKHTATGKIIPQYQYRRKDAGQYTQLTEHEAFYLNIDQIEQRLKGIQTNTDNIWSVILISLIIGIIIGVLTLI